jgi:creatinine amidohydrolase
MIVLPRRDWVDMTWEDFTSPERGTWIAVLPIAAVEQHGPHLPLGTDALIATAYLDRVRARLPAELPVSFLPLQSIGTSEEHRAFPGTVSVSATGVIGVLIDIGASVHRADVRKLVIINSHGGNASALQIAARRLRVELGMMVVHASWFDFGYPEQTFTAVERAHGIHAGEIETSILLASYPALVRSDRAEKFESQGEVIAREFRRLRMEDRLAWMTQDLHPSGAVGDARNASAAKGEAALAHGASAFVELLEEVSRFDVARLERGPMS